MVSYLKSVTSFMNHEVMIAKVNFHQTEEILTIWYFHTYIYIYNHPFFSTPPGRLDSSESHIQSYPIQKFPSQKAIHLDVWPTFYRARMLPKWPSPEIACWFVAVDVPTSREVSQLGGKKYSWVKTAGSWLGMGVFGVWRVEEVNFCWWMGSFFPDVFWAISLWSNASVVPLQLAQKRLVQFDCA